MGGRVSYRARVRPVRGVNEDRGSARRAGTRAARAKRERSGDAPAKIASRASRRASRRRGRDEVRRARARRARREYVPVGCYRDCKLSDDGKTDACPRANQRARRRCVRVCPLSPRTVKALVPPPRPHTPDRSRAPRSRVTRAHVRRRPRRPTRASRERRKDARSSVSPWSRSARRFSSR